MNTLDKEVNEKLRGTKYVCIEGKIYVDPAGDRPYSSQKHDTCAGEQSNDSRVQPYQRSAKTVLQGSTSFSESNMDIDVNLPEKCSCYQCSIN